MKYTVQDLKKCRVAIMAKLKILKGEYELFFQRDHQGHIIYKGDYGYGTWEHFDWAYGTYEHFKAILPDLTELEFIELSIENDKFYGFSNFDQYWTDRIDEYFDRQKDEFIRHIKQKRLFDESKP